MMWKYVVGPERPQMTIRRMRVACWITKVTNRVKVKVKVKLSRYRLEQALGDPEG
jgi:hypothetical protein